MRPVFLRWCVGWALALGLGAAIVAAQAPAASAPTLTDLEQTRLDLLQLRTAYAQLLAQFDSCKAEVGSTYAALGTLRAQAAAQQIGTDAAALKTTIEAAHPGYTFDLKTQTLTKTPTPPAKSGGRR